MIRALFTGMLLILIFHNGFSFDSKRQIVTINRGLYVDMFDGVELYQLGLRTFSLQYQHELYAFGKRSLYGGFGVGVTENHFQPEGQNTLLTLSTRIQSAFKESFFFYGFNGEYWFNKHYLLLLKSGYSYRVYKGFSLEAVFAPVIFQSFLQEGQRTNKWFWLRGTVLVQMQIGISFKF